MKKNYVIPESVVISLDQEDILTGSLTYTDNDQPALPDLSWHLFDI